MGNILDGDILQELLGITLSSPAAFAFLSSTITFHLLCQLNKYNKISFLEQNQF